MLGRQGRLSAMLVERGGIKWDAIARQKIE
jgi:hypothetical protein